MVRPERTSGVGRVSAEVRRAAGFALLIGAVVQLPMVFMAARGADAERGSLLDSIVSATQLPGLLLTARKEAPAPAADPFLDPAVVTQTARSVLPPGLTLAAVNTIVMALVAFVALRTLHAIWPRRAPGRPLRPSAR